MSVTGMLVIQKQYLGFWLFKVIFHYLKRVLSKRPYVPEGYPQYFLAVFSENDETRDVVYLKELNSRSTCCYPYSVVMTILG